MQIFLSLGSNMGDRRALLDEAVRMIGLRVGLVESVSDYVETEPWGFVSAFPFLNACVRVEASLDPWQVLAVTQEIERELGRTAKSTDGQYHDRPIDIDLLMAFDTGSAPALPAHGADGERTLQSLVAGSVRVDGWRDIGGRPQRLTLPHPLMMGREFVLTPLRQVLE